MKFQKVKEGLVEVNVPKGRIYDADVFYNKDAEFTRDISVAVLSVFQKTLDDNMEILDSLSASGISGIRYAKEVKKIKAILNDRNPEAVKLIKNNAEHNKVKVEITNKDANLIMREKLYDFIDIDPFGTPSVFMDSAAHSVKFNRLLSVTATDQSALSGSAPNACLRKYGIRATRTSYYKELGLRVLLTYIMNSFMRYNKSFRPLLCFSHKHYYRVYGIVEGSAKIAKQLKDYKYVDKSGSIYLGPIKDNDFIIDVIDEIRKRKFKLAGDEIDLLNKILSEIDEPFYYNVNKMHLKKVPKIDKMIVKLKQKGFNASRSSLCETGIKTNAKLEEFVYLIKTN